MRYMLKVNLAGKEFKVEIFVALKKKKIWLHTV